MCVPTGPHGAGTFESPMPSGCPISGAVYIPAGVARTESCLGPVCCAMMVALLPLLLQRGVFLINGGTNFTCDWLAAGTGQCVSCVRLILDGIRTRLWSLAGYGKVLVGNVLTRVSGKFCHARRLGHYRVTMRERSYAVVSAAVAVSGSFAVKQDVARFAAWVSHNISTTTVADAGIRLGP